MSGDLPAALVQNRCHALVNRQQNLARIFRDAERACREHASHQIAEPTEMRDHLPQNDADGVKAAIVRIGMSDPRKIDIFDELTESHGFFTSKNFLPRVGATSKPGCVNARVLHSLHLKNVSLYSEPVLSDKIKYVQDICRYEDKEQTITSKTDYIISAFGSTLIYSEGLPNFGKYREERAKLEKDLLVKSDTELVRDTFTHRPDTGVEKIPTI
ncbi:hypothetical protein KIN20_033770 [Parelaphostrongylus tenuis]|uniref:Uncharacterized protein n=1 Tax=Parelaphostrongylus tenuis TaxID=148309 RepID=A0AAD5WJ56_PARTN|nr:hypothetical protein KIN20_033770 [Parelaphostrongylus tenuis]